MFDDAAVAGGDGDRSCGAGRAAHRVKQDVRHVGGQAHAAASCKPHAFEADGRAGALRCAVAGAAAVCGGAGVQQVAGAVVGMMKTDPHRMVACHRLAARVLQVGHHFRGAAL